MHGYTAPYVAHDDKKEATEMLRRALCLIGAGLMATSASAAPPPASGFFIGAMAGESELNLGLRASLNDGGLRFYFLDDRDRSFVVFSGYKFTENLAVELRYGELGSFRLDGPFVSEPDFDVTVFSGHLVGLVPFGQSGWEFSGQVGVGQLDIDCRGCSNETAWSWGFGLRFYPLPRFGIGLQWDSYDWDTSEDVHSTQLALQYLF
jgi:hypothetical protein